MGDRSLDDFLDAGSDDTDESDGSDATAESDISDESGATEEQADSAASAGSADEAEADDEDDADPAGSTTDNTDDSPGVDPDAVEPAVSTYVWDDGGGECAACGATVDRRWRQEDDLVCADCKEW